MEIFKYNELFAQLKEVVEGNYEDILKIGISEKMYTFLSQSLKEDENLEEILKLRVVLVPHLEDGYQIQLKNESPLKYADKKIAFDFLQNAMKGRSETYIKALNESICPECKEKRQLSFVHQNCSFVEEFRNYYLACDECQSEIWNNYEIMWEEVAPYGR